MKKFYTLSDAGGVRIGNRQFQMLIPIGQGDGITCVNFLEQEDDLPLEAKYFTCFKGENVKIYAYDCGSCDMIVATISGRFGAYYNNRNVYFVRWE